MTAYRGSRRIYPLLLILGTNELHASAAVPPGDNPRYPLQGGCVVPWADLYFLEKINLAPTSIHTPDLPARSLVSVLINQPGSNFEVFMYSGFNFWFLYGRCIMAILETW